MEIHTFSFKRMYMKMPSGKWRPFCLSLNVLTDHETKFYDVTMSKIIHHITWYIPFQSHCWVIIGLGDGLVPILAPSHHLNPTFSMMLQWVKTLIISIGLMQENITPLLTHWSYIFLVLTHRSYLMQARCHHGWMPTYIQCLYAPSAVPVILLSEGPTTAPCCPHLGKCNMKAKVITRWLSARKT